MCRMARRLKTRADVPENMPRRADPFLSDPGFLEAFRAGRPEALDRVYRTYKRPLRNFILRGFSFRSEGRQMYFGGMASEADVDDVLHETFRRAFGPRARAAYDGVRPYKNYLFTIARNAVITDLTLRQRHIPVGETLTRDTPLEEMSPLECWVRSRRATLEQDSVRDSEEELERLEIYALLAGFMEHLDAEEGRFFKLRFLGLESQERTARTLGWNRAKVRKLEAKLRKAFLTHARGTGYLEQRSEGRKIRKADPTPRYGQMRARSREIWRSARTDPANGVVLEAA